MLPDAWSATIAAAVLRRGAALHAASAVLSLVALAAAAAMSLTVPIAAATVAVGLVEFWLGARTAIDAELFDALATSADLKGLDRSLHDLGLRAEDTTTKPLVVRIRAAFRLLKLQVVALVLQAGVLLAGFAHA